ncbi:MAG: BLUF domain-containing protein [Phycisphaeraceae bacterium]
MTHLVYVSHTFGTLTHEKVRELASDSAARNQQIDVTGVMVYGNQHVMQLLEGDLHVVHALFQKIARDRRHHHVTRIAFYPVPQRQFANWSMELINLDDHSRLDHERLRDILSRQAAVPTHDATAYARLTEELLEEFRKQLMPNLNAVPRDTCSLSA